MICDLSDKIDRQKAVTRFKYLLEKEAHIELKKVSKPKTIQQNKYIHVCFSLFGIHFGYTLAEAKTLLKRECHFMVYEKNGQKFLRSVADLDDVEISDLIDWVRDYAGKNGCYIPTSEEYLESKYSIDKEIERNKSYL